MLCVLVLLLSLLLLGTTYHYVYHYHDHYCCCVSAPADADALGEVHDLEHEREGGDGQRADDHLRSRYLCVRFLRFATRVYYCLFSVSLLHILCYCLCFFQSPQKASVQGAMETSKPIRRQHESYRSREIKGEGRGAISAAGFQSRSSHRGDDFFADSGIYRHIMFASMPKAPFEAHRRPVWASL